MNTAYTVKHIQKGPTLSPTVEGPGNFDPYEVFTLRDGSHTISLSDGSCGKVEIGPLVVTDRPEIFEPR